MSLMRLAYLAVLSLVIAGLVHIGSLLGVPWVATAGPYERLGGIAADGRFVVLADEGDGANLLPFRDPAFVTAACRFDLAKGPVTVTAALPSTYGAVSVHSRYGQPFYSLTDRAATDGGVEITIYSKDDVAAAEIEDPAEGRPQLRIVSPTPTGFVLVRLFAAGASARPTLRELAGKAFCGPAATRKLSS
jgi:uncharacterized membrane protein